MQLFGEHLQVILLAVLRGRERRAVLEPCLAERIAFACGSSSSALSAKVISCVAGTPSPAVHQQPTGQPRRRRVGEQLIEIWMLDALDIETVLCNFRSPTSMLQTHESAPCLRQTTP